MVTSVEVAGVEVAGRCKQVVMRMEAAGAGSWQWRTVEATEVVAVVMVAGVEAAGCCELAMQQLEEAGGSRQQWEKV